METSTLKKLIIAQAAKKFGWGTSPLKSMIWLGKSVRSDLSDYEPRPEWGGNCSSSDEENEKVYKNHVRAVKLHEIQIRKQVMMFAEKMTLADVLLGLTAQFEKSTRRYVQLRNSHRGTIERLVKIGFTQLDCVALSIKKPSFQDLKGIPHDKLLALDAVVLGTLSHTELHEQSTCYENGSNGRRRWRDDGAVAGKRLTIADILALRPQNIRGQGATRTIIALRELGFSSNDGPFLSEETDPRQKLVESLIVENGLSRNDAIRFVEIAAKRNWI